MKTERDLYQQHYKTSRDYKFYVKHEMTEKQIFEFNNGKYSVDCVNDGWKIWRASANREGYKLVPVDVLERSIGHISIALCHPSTSKMEEDIMHRDMDIIDNFVMVACDE